MTKLEYILAKNESLTRIHVLFRFCPHDFGMEDYNCDNKTCEECWNEEVQS